VGCYALQARLARGDLTALQEARPLWSQGAAQPESCGPLFDALVMRGQITEEDVWTRVRLALEAGNVSFVKALMPYLPTAKRIAGRELDSVARNPQRYLERRPLPLKTQADRELAMFATWRVAQSLPAVAASRLEKYDSVLPVADRGYVWAQVATAGALKHRSEALDWFKRAGDAPLSDRQLGWKTRIGLRTGNWQSVLAAIDAMSAREAQLAPWRYWKGRAMLALGNTADGIALLAPLSAEHSFYGQLATGVARLAASLHRRPARRAAPSAHRASSARSSSSSSACATRGLWNGAGPPAATTIASWSRPPRSPGATAGTSAPSIRPSVPRHCTILRCASPPPTVKSSATIRARWIWMRPGSTAGRQGALCGARSSAGAQGLMQLMPSTARQVARRLGLPGFQRHQVISVDTNINLGTYHLRQLLDDLDNQAVLASAEVQRGAAAGPTARAGTAGRSRVRRVHPVRGTRDYVRKVSNTMYYSRLFGQPYEPQAAAGISGRARSTK
jgi:soluble lytic murein transglycosylase